MKYNQENIEENDAETRPYRKKARAKAEKATGEAILKAALAAFTQETYERVTLQSIADDSDVTVQTVLRRFESKEKLFEAVAERETPRILASREVADDAGLRAALEALLNHYEQDGDVILRFVAQEHLFDPVHKIVERGRREHREWVERHCHDFLSASEGVERERLLHAAIVATDLSTWKLLRRDLGLERSEVAAVMNTLLIGLKGRT